MTDHEINTLYQQQSTEQPPIDVDNKILKLAQESILETASLPVKKSSQRYVPFTMAASFMLVGLLVLNFPDNYMNDHELTEPNFNDSIADDLLQEESRLKKQNTIHSRSNSSLSSSSLKSAPAVKEIMPMLDSSQEVLEFMPSASAINEAQSKQKMIDNNQQLQRRKMSQLKLNKLTLLQQIAEKLEINQPEKAAELTKEYIESFGIEQLPQKYHYLLK